MEMEDVWSENAPDSLEDLCISFCAGHLETFTDVNPTTGMYMLKSGVSLPKAICDKLLSVYIDSGDVFCNKFLNIFSNTLGTQLSSLIIPQSDVTDAGLESIMGQPIIDLDISHCLHITDGCIPVINNMRKTLRSLCMETTPLQLVNLDSNHSCEKTDLKMFDFPYLRRLSLKNFSFQVPDSEYILLGILTSPKLLTNLDFSRCSMSVDAIDCLMEMNNLVSLTLADVEIQDLNVALKNIGKLKRLRHLDLSQGNEDIIPVMYENPEENLRHVVSNLPCLTSLDISGTNLAGFEKTDLTSHRPAAKNKSESLEEAVKRKDLCAVVGLEGRYLEFLGLLGCAYGACNRENLPCKRVTGDNNESQVLLSVQVYQDRCNLLTKALNNLFPLFRFSTVYNQCAALEGILAGMKRHPKDRHVQISGSASLFYIAKGDKKSYLTQKQKRLIIDLLLMGMERFPYEQTMMRNGCLTLCHFNIPVDVLYCYRKLVQILLVMLETEHQDEFIHSIGIFLLNCLACQVDGKEKEMVGSMGAIETMLNIIHRKVQQDECDDVMEVAWSTMWNVTDETASNCKRFIDKDGMQLFLLCLSKFEEHGELLRNMMGLMGNIAEVKTLRPRLMTTEYVSVFSDLLDSTSDGIEVSYNAAGVLAHMASDGPETWVLDKPSRDEVLTRLVNAVNHWDIKSKRNINYRSFEPILRLLTVYNTPQVQHWAIWALCNLTCFCPEKYCPLLEKENGIVLLQQLLKEPGPYEKIRQLSRQVLEQISRWKNVQLVDINVSANESTSNVEESAARENSGNERQQLNRDAYEDNDQRGGAEGGLVSDEDISEGAEEQEHDISEDNDLAEDSHHSASESD